MAGIGTFISPGKSLERAITRARLADELGFDSAYTTHIAGRDSMTVLAAYAVTTNNIRVGTGVLPIFSRTPVSTAQTAATIDELSGGRMVLGLGVSHAVTVENWFDSKITKPVSQMREYVAIVRAILRRQEPLEHHGAHYDIPYSGADATGLGTPLKIIVRPLRPEIPIYLAAIGPRNVALAAEIADGWLPIFFSPERFGDTHRPSLEEGFARRGGRPDDWDLAPQVPVALADDLAAARDALRPLLALYVGGMGARGQNFYARLAARYGFEAEAAQIQDLYLEGKTPQAAAAVPDALIDQVALVGDRARIADRLAAFEECGATTLILQTRQPEALRLLAELAT
jgi:F420-dependent oxidoreductase-like protein